MIHTTTQTPTTRRIAVLALVAVMLAVGAVALVGPALATEHVDTLAGDGTDEVEDFNASEDRFIEYTLDADDTDFGTDGTEEVAMNVSYDGIEHAVNASVEVDGAAASATINISHADLETLPGDANATTTANVTAWGVDEDGNVSTGPEEFEVDINFGDDRAVRYYAENTTAFDTDVETEDPVFGFFARAGDAIPGVFNIDEGEHPDVHQIESTVGIAGDNTTVYYYLSEDGDMDDAFTDAADAYTERETPVLGMVAVADDQLVPVFYQEANEDLVDADDDTYAVYDGDVLTLEVGEDFEDDDEIETYVGSHNALHETLTFGIGDVVEAYDDGLGFWTIGSEFGWRAAASAWAPVIGAVVTAGGLALYTRRRPTEA